jgi:hypothetical protein
LGGVLNRMLKQPMPTRTRLRRLNRLEKTDLWTHEPSQCGRGIGMDEEAENGVDIFAADEPDQSKYDARIHPAAGVKGRHPNPAFPQLIHHRPPPVQARNMYMDVLFPCQAKGQFPDHRGRSANLEIGDQKEDSPRHSNGSLPEFFSNPERE